MVEETRDKIDKTNPVAVIKQFEETLDLAIKGEQKKIPKWSVDVITKMKDKHIGSLQSQIGYLKSNKKTEFFQLYTEEVENLVSSYEKKFDELIGEKEIVFEKFKEELLESLKIKLATNNVLSDFIDKNKSYNDIITIEKTNSVFSDNPELLQVSDVSFLRHMYCRDFLKINNKCDSHYCDKIIGLFFELNYNDFFDNAKNQIKKLERLFEESLAFNDLVTTHGVFQELKKADVLLDSVSKVKIEKIDIDFEKYIKDVTEVEKLKKHIEDKKKYEFSEQ